jgi:hypothetical protein
MLHKNLAEFLKIMSSMRIAVFQQAFQLAVKIMDPFARRLSNLQHPLPATRIRDFCAQVEPLVNKSAV